MALINNCMGGIEVDFNSTILVYAKYHMNNKGTVEEQENIFEKGFKINCTYFSAGDAKFNFLIRSNAIDHRLNSL